MNKEYLLELYILLFEKIFNTNNKELKNKVWQKIKINTTLLKLATKINGNTFYSNIIVYMILKDKELYNTPIYLNLINKIYENEHLARTKINNLETSTFLFITLDNEDLLLTKEQKIFLIFEAEKCPFTEKYYKENKSIVTNTHGAGIFDIRFKILKNQNFTLKEKANLLFLFYPDDQIKIDVLSELEWEIAKELKVIDYKNNYDNIYNLADKDIKKSLENKNKYIKILSTINLCEFIKSKISDEEMKKYKNYM